MSLKIGIVCYPTYGGSGVVATELGMALAKLGHEVHFISYRMPARLNSFTENVFYHEVSMYDYPLFDHMPYETILASKIVDIALSNDLDLVHAHYAIPHASASLMAKAILKDKGKRLALVTTLHGTDITLVGKDATFEPVVSYSINYSNAVTTVSESLKRDTYANFLLDKDIAVIPNFIDFERFGKQKKDHFKQVLAPNNEKILVHTSNFRKVKRVDDVIRVYSEVQKKVPSKLLLIGDGPERANLETTCRGLGVCDNIHFLGKQQPVEEILSVCDLFLMTSEFESFGLSALEAMACEVPVISSNTGGLPELVQDDVTGYLHDVGDIGSMAASAIKLLSDEKKLETFKQNAFKRAHDFELSKIVQQYLDVYESVI
jgi:N-acetyl-alpha-D-glucosaminyl L-malate synthase BshA